MRLPLDDFLFFCILKTVPIEVVNRKVVFDFVVEVGELSFEQEVELVVEVIVEVVELEPVERLADVAVHGDDEIG